MAKIVIELDTRNPMDRIVNSFYKASEKYKLRLEKIIEEKEADIVRREKEVQAKWNEIRGVRKRLEKIDVETKHLEILRHRANYDLAIVNKKRKQLDEERAKYSQIRESRLNIDEKDIPKYGRVFNEYVPEIVMDTLRSFMQNNNYSMAYLEYSALANQILHVSSINIEDERDKYKIGGLDSDSNLKYIAMRMKNGNVVITTRSYALRLITSPEIVSVPY